MFDLCVESCSVYWILRKTAAFSTGIHWYVHPCAKVIALFSICENFLILYFSNFLEILGIKIEELVNIYLIFPRYWPFVWGIHRRTVNSPHKGQWRGALMFSFICAWINSWVNNREAGDLRRHRAHYDVTVMFRQQKVWLIEVWRRISASVNWVTVAKPLTEPMLTHCYFDPRKKLRMLKS